MILALDFDGVICDSIVECMLLANAAFDKSTETNNMTQYPSVPYKVKQGFLKQRYFVNHAAEYWFLLHCINNDKHLIDQNDFDYKKVKYIDEMKKFEKDFYALRNQIRISNPGYWLSLHSMFSEFLLYWNMIKEMFELYIVTMKDSSSVLDILNHNNIEFPANRIMGYIGNTNKADSILNIAKSNNVSAQDIYFVDDNIFQLKEVTATGSKCFLASWGYCDPNIGELPSGIKSINNLEELILYTRMNETS